MKEDDNKIFKNTSSKPNQNILFNNNDNFETLKSRPKKKNPFQKIEKNMNLFDIFNNIFFYNKEQTLIKDEILNGKDKSYLERIYIKFYSERREKILIDYFDNFIKNNVLKIFKRKDLRQHPILNIVRKNIETILECFGLYKLTYYQYYFPEKEKPAEFLRENMEAAKIFRMTFGIGEDTINEEILLKKLDENDNDIYKVFQQIYG